MKRICIFSDDPESFFKANEKAFDGLVVIQSHIDLNSQDGIFDIYEMIRRHNPVSIVMVPDYSKSSIASMQLIERSEYKNSVLYYPPIDTTAEQLKNHWQPMQEKIGERALPIDCREEDLAVILEQYASAVSEISSASSS